jgi:hypothetical protein
VNRPGPGPDLQPRSLIAAADNKPADDYPRAIADDYPGWEVRHANGHWTAWCPAITVHAPTPAGLRAAIEQAITGDSSP